MSTELLQLPNGDWIDATAVRAIRQLAASIFFNTSFGQDASTYGPRVVIEVEVAEKQYVSISLACKNDDDATMLRDDLAKQINSRRTPRD